MQAAPFVEHDVGVGGAWVGGAGVGGTGVGGTWEDVGLLVIMGKTHSQTVGATEVDGTDEGFWIGDEDGTLDVVGRSEGDDVGLREVGSVPGASQIFKPPPRLTQAASDEQHPVFLEHSCPLSEH